MPEGITELLGSLGLDALLNTGASAATDAGLGAAATAGAGAVGDAALSGLVDLGLTGVGTGLGGAATGLGESAVGGAGAIADTAAGAGLEGLLTSPAALSSVTAGPDVTVTPTTPAPTPTVGTAPGLTAVGPTAGTPAGSLSAGGFELGGQAPGAASAVAPVGGAGASPTDLTTAGGATAAPKAGESFIDKMVSGASKSIQNNWLPAGIGLGALGYNLLKGNQQSPAQSNMAGIAAPAKAEAGKIVAQGEGLTNYLPSGTLPPDMEASLTKATQDAKTRAISNAAAQGLPTDPTKNTTLAQTLANIDREAVATKTQMEGELLKGGTTLINTGLQSAGLSSELYNKLANLDKSDQKAISDALANFMKALGGTNQGGLSLKLG